MSRKAKKGDAFLDALKALERIHKRNKTWRLGQLLDNLSKRDPAKVYNASDEDFLEATRSYDKALKVTEQKRKERAKSVKARKAVVIPQVDTLEHPAAE